MKKTIKNTLVFVLILALFTACSKFEDGPKISLRSIEKRIYGTYRIEYFSKNGTDLTDYWNQYYDLTFYFYFDISGVYPEVHGSEVKGFVDSSGVMKYYNSPNGYIYIEEDKDVSIWMINTLDSIQYPNRQFYPLFTYIGNEPESPYYTVTRLKNDEMWLMFYEGSDYYEIHFKE